MMLDCFVVINFLLNFLRSFRILNFNVFNIVVMFFLFSFLSFQFNYYVYSHVA